MKKNLLLFLALSITAYSFVACKGDIPEDEIAGDWSGTIETRITERRNTTRLYPGGDTIPGQFSFKSDGTFIQTSSGSEHKGTWVSTDLNFGITYNLDGISIVFDKITNENNSQVWVAEKKTEILIIDRWDREDTHDAMEFTTILISR
jgi:hypothetical protein